MPRYIDIEELKLAKFINQCTTYMIGWNDAIDAVIDNATTADGVIVPPVKMGQTVYQINRTPHGGEVYELTVKNIVYDTNAVSFDETAIGVHIFATKEEAERALTERGGGDG